MGREYHSVDGRLLLAEVNEVFELKLDAEDIDTLGGWVSVRVEMPPQIGQLISYADYEFVIEEVDNMRVNRVLLRKIANDEAEGSDRIATAVGQRCRKLVASDDTALRNQDRRHVKKTHVPPLSIKKL